MVLGKFLLLSVSFYLSYHARCSLKWIDPTCPVKLQGVSKLKSNYFIAFSANDFAALDDFTLDNDLCPIGNCSLYKATARLSPNYQYSSVKPDLR